VSYYERHVFFCCNQRMPGEVCCNNHGAQEMREYAKDKIKALRLSGPGKVRINSAGCLDRCNEGPAMVVYPEGVWYTYVDREDIDEIIREHLQGGRVVERLNETDCSRGSPDRRSAGKSKRYQRSRRRA
jgi:(2Fe-2S) ferredoxin